jgi:uncharacterized membrane protein YccC
MKAKRSWRTTLGGCILAAGGFLLVIEDPLLKMVGGICVAVGGFLTGVAARDNKLTSEDVGAN